MTPAEEIRQAAAKVRDEHPDLFSREFTERLCALLEGCAEEAKWMAGPDDFEVCDEPASVRSALAVARALNGGAS